MVVYDNEWKTKENNNWTKDKIEPQHIFYETKHSHINFLVSNSQGPVVWKPITANPVLKCPFLILLFKSNYRCQILRHNFKAAQVKLLSENNALKSTFLWIKSELKLDANLGLA